MSLLNDIPLSALQYHLTAPYQCSYLPEQKARSQVATPVFMINPTTFAKLVQKGFRRSGTYTYRPHCDNCRACIPIRIDSAKFVANRSQRRAWKQHRDLHTRIRPLHDQPEYYRLYQRYQKARHPNGGMDQDDLAAYQNFLLKSHVESFLVEFREQGVLRMVSLIDVLNDGLSAVYTFYDPDLPHTSFGTYNTLWQLDLCRQLGLKFVYLGYWVQGSQKMAYKIQYQPAQGLIDQRWQTLGKTTPSESPRT
ncbi:MAG: arginyltransferase [Pseudomonadota bacterium]